MDKPTSLYIDVVRIAAVLLVFIDHAKRPSFTGGFLYPLGIYGQEAVAAFFVLSGLVIANATIGRGLTLRRYLAARLSRLWSVVIPAILLTVALDCYGWHLAPTLYADAAVPPWTFDAASLWRAISPALFLNSVPPFDAEVGSNGPFWSLSYEALYYVMFGIAVLLRGWPRILLLTLSILVAGPAIRALLPIWLLGVAVRLCLGRTIRPPVAWAGWLGSIAALVVLLALKYRIMTLLQHAPLGLRHWPLTPEVLVEKYAPSLLIALNILCFGAIAPHFARLCAILGAPVRFVVARSFSIYLYQAPVLFFIAAVGHQVPMGAVRTAMIYGLGLAACMALAEWTELRRNLLFGWLAGPRVDHWLTGRPAQPRP